MKPKVLGISAGPRLKGNSDLLLRQALAGAESENAATEYVHLYDYKIAPCVECNSCFKTGKCRIEDDFQVLMDKMLSCHRLIFATGIFFMSVTAQAKLLIDRCQCLWARKYVLHESLKAPSGVLPKGTPHGTFGSADYARHPGPPKAGSQDPPQIENQDRLALVIAVGGSKSRKMFESIRLTMKYYLDVLDFYYFANLFVNGIDQKGRIKQHPSALDEAFRLGRELTLAKAQPHQTRDIILTAD